MAGPAAAYADSFPGAKAALEMGASKRSSTKLRGSLSVSFLVKYILTA